MKKSTKIWLAIAGIALIALGVLCICRPVATLFASAWLLGCIVLLSGIFTLMFTFRTQQFLPNSGTRMLSGLLQIFLGIFFLCNSPAVMVSLPFVFAFWVMVEGITLFIESFDFKKFGFGNWWCICLLGIIGAVLGILGFVYPDITAGTLAVLIGIAIILHGVAYLVALFGVNKFERNVKDFRNQVADFKNQVNNQINETVAE